MKSSTKLPPYVSQSRRNAHEAAMRKRETWMPKLQLAMRIHNRNTGLFNRFHQRGF
jgi:hypothetical protein